MFPKLKQEIGSRSSERLASIPEVLMRDFGACVKATVGNTQHSAMNSSVIPTVFTRFREGEFELLTKFGIELRQVLHAEQEYDLFEPLKPGEEVKYSTTLSSVVEKKGKDAKMAFMVFETQFIRTKDLVNVANSRSTIVYREAEAK